MMDVYQSIIRQKKQETVELRIPTYTHDYEIKSDYNNPIINKDYNPTLMDNNYNKSINDIIDINDIPDFPDNNNIKK